MLHSGISVIIPSYNHAGSLSFCLKSIFKQSLQPADIIVVDDGSIDDTKKVVEPFLDRVKYIYQKNAGAPSARNRGFRESSGKYIIFCDADIVMQRNMLQIMFEVLEKDEGLSFVYSGFKFGWKSFKGIDFSPKRLFSENYIHTTSLIRKSDFVGFDENIKRLQDWDMWLTMVERGMKGKCISQKPLFKVSIDGKSRIGSKWVPKIFYRLPWGIIGWRPKSIIGYQEVKAVLAQKHKNIK